MDGVLIEAKDWHFEALNRALDLFGMAISRVDHETTFDGLPTSRKLEILSIERGLPRELHSFLNEMKQRYTTEMVHTLCKPRFAQERALSALKAQGYKMAVCSNSIRSTVQLMMVRISAIVDADFSVIVDGKSGPSGTRRGGAQVLGRNVSQSSTISLKRAAARPASGLVLVD
jgi:beta-phosphoglucomutase